ncbi:hypothetical protein VM1G_11637 [Cytospora mali]|uniref:Uncharacterized protein n=1 Tax=Cytospora mali TaxID=578113 RepID=A0A194W0D9_CYTMA|nr:hypothetical protein VM1G_11637 [Valsa mali]
MPSSKGKPTDPELREELKDGKLNLTPHSSMSEVSANFGQRSSRSQTRAVAEKDNEYEKQGGGYENEPGSKNEPKGGKPEPKSESKKKKERDS